MTENGAFAGDLFQRKLLAERIIQFLHRNEDGMVITVDAPWGDGKTYFAKNFETLMTNTDYKGTAIYIDAFESDYIEDPLVLLTGAIYGKLAEAKIPGSIGAKFLDRFLKVGKAVAPTVAKACISVATGGIFNARCQEKAIAAISKIDSNVLTEQVKQYEKNKKSINDFKDTLQEIGLEYRNKSKTTTCPEGLPLVILIDELDRCTPSFAVKLLERIKHFFSVKNVFFILLVNKTQLVEYVKGLYGQGVDGEAYIEKFVDLPLSLTSLPINQSDYNATIYVKKCLQKPTSKEQEVKEKYKMFEDFLSLWCTDSNFSLRCIDKYFSYVKFIEVTSLKRIFIPYVGLLILLKIKKPTLYSGFLARESKASQDVIAFFRDDMSSNKIFNLLTGSRNISLIKIIETMVDSYKRQSNRRNHSTDSRVSLSEALESIIAMCDAQGTTTGDAFITAAQYIDFKIDLECTT